MTRQQVVAIMQQMGLAPNKRYGQNFLIDTSVVHRIIQAASCRGVSVLEIGPGLGSLTELLVEEASSVVAVEIDAGFCRYLGERFGGRITLLHEDFLKIDPPQTECVVANLPYYCSSEIIFTIAQRSSAASAVVMVQREMAQRLLAKSSSDSYGAPAVSLWLDMHCEILFDIPAGSFFPPPEVVSSVIRLTRVSRDIPQSVRDTFHLIVRAGFWARRKQFYACLTKSPFVTIDKERAAALIEHLGRDARVRAEELSPEEFLSASFFLNGKK